jgi:hypothetical protein
VNLEQWEVPVDKAQAFAEKFRTLLQYLVRIATVGALKIPILYHRNVAIFTSANVIAFVNRNWQFGSICAHCALLLQ